MWTLRVLAIVAGLVLTVLLFQQGYDDWTGTAQDPFANEPSRQWSFISMIARAAIGLVVTAAAVRLAWRPKRRTDRRS